MSETQQPVAEMETAALQEEYGGVDLDALTKDNDLRQRQIAVWEELDDRDIAEFPECDNCEETEWSWLSGGVPICGFCRSMPGTELSDAVTETVHTITTSEIE